MSTQVKGMKKFAWLLGMAAILVGSCLTGQAMASSTLSTDDCIKCHEGPPRDIAANGKRHKEKVTCLDCHVGHPPSVRDNIPQCSKCHQAKDRAHFGLDNCLGCHSNPHTPLDITLPANATAPCLTCHTDQRASLEQYPSKHTTNVECSTCHRERHGYIPKCAECHKPHSEGQQQSDCLTCHNPHKPLQVAYPDNVASENCAACHGVAFDMLRASNAKHKTFECAFCHAKVHKTVPKCQDCHGMPHPAGIHNKFPVCGSCHGVAHNIVK